MRQISVLTFASIPIDGYFVGRNKRLHQKTSRRHAKTGAGVVYRHNLNSLAFAVPNGIACPYHQENWK